MAFTKQDFINSSIGLAALIVAILAYKDKDAINKLTDISNTQQAQLHNLDSQLILLDSQLNQISREVNLLKLQTDISRDQDQQLVKILKKSGLQYDNLSAQLQISKKTVENSNKLEFFRRKSENARLKIVYNKLVDAYTLVKYPVEEDTTRQRLFLNAVRPVYDQCLQNTIFVENEELNNILINLINRNINISWNLGLSLDKLTIMVREKGVRRQITSPQELEQHKIDDFGFYLKDEVDFTKKLGVYTDNILNDIRNEQIIIMKNN